MTFKRAVWVFDFGSVFMVRDERENVVYDRP